MAIVLQIVADDQRRPVRALSAAAHALPGADRFDRCAVAELNQVRPPDRTAADSLRIIASKALVVEQLGCDVGQVPAACALVSDTIQMYGSRPVSAARSAAASVTSVDLAPPRGARTLSFHPRGRGASSHTASQRCNCDAGLAKCRDR